MSTPSITYEDKVQSVDSMRPHWRIIAEKLAGESYPMFQMLTNPKEIQKIQETAEQWKKSYEALVVLGTGGSSLGAKTLCSLQENPFNPGPVYFLENVDTTTLNALLQKIKLEKTLFLVISKSGETAETLLQFLCMLEACQERGLSQDKWPHHFTVLTEEKPSSLRQLAEKLSLPTLPHNPQIGGRFSVFSNVGLLPAAFAGIDISAFLKGAHDLVQNADDPLIHAGTFHVQAMSVGKNMTVLMPYADRLMSFVRWWAQLWAESLGKQGRGSTPIMALGTVDQHSQLQLYRDGPHDKTYTLLYLTEDAAPSRPHAMQAEIKTLDYLKGVSLDRLNRTEARATAQTLINQGHPVRTITMPAVTPAVMGYLMAQLVLETLLMAQVMGVDPFDQPGVEESKILTRQFLERD